MFRLPFVPAHKFDAALEEIATLKQERDDETRKAAEARRDATTLAAERDKLADEVERLKGVARRAQDAGSAAISERTGLIAKFRSLSNDLWNLTE